MPGLARAAEAGPRVWARRVFLLVLLALAGAAVYTRRDELLEALREIAPWAVPVAFVPALFSMATSFSAWRTLLRDLGTELAPRPAARVFFVAQLGKYAPGGVWAILTQMELSREHSVPRRSILVVGVVALVISITSGLTIALVMLPFAVPEAFERFWWAMAALPVLVVMLHPAVLGRAVDRLLVLARREPLPRRPSGRGVGVAAAFQVGTWIFLGLHAWVLLIGLGAPVAESLPIAIGGYALAYAAGQLAIGFPGGFGVREAALTLVMSAAVGVPAALLLALLSRFVLVLVDVSLAGAQLAIGRGRRPVDGR